MYGLSTGSKLTSACALRATGASALQWQEEIGVNQARRTGPLAEPVLALRSAAAPPAAQGAPADTPGGSSGALPPLQPAALAPAPPGNALAHDGIAPAGGSGAGMEAAAGPASAGNGPAHDGAAPAGGDSMVAASPAGVTAAAAPARAAAAELARRCKRKKKDRDAGKVLQGAAG